ncbi:MAG: hypothetical protein HZA46_11925 [Planctomycetales bacterium]|nr:hypothetical protein [Planctomycetales bacterium]
MNFRFSIFDFRFVPTGSSGGVASLIAAGLLFGGIVGCQPASPVTVRVLADASAASTGGTVDAGPATTPEGYGNFVGTVTLNGNAPQLTPVVKAGDAGVKDREVCGVMDVPDESLVVNPANKGIANVVLFLEKKPANIKADLAATPTDPVIFDQKGCRFLPHVSIVRINQPLLILSADAVAHNTHTFPNRNNGFNQAIPANERKGVPCPYSKPEANPIEVKCDLHTWMKAYHFPVDHPYVAVTDADGKFEIKGLPAGKHVFKVWQEKVKDSSKLLERKLEITIEPDKDTTKDLSYASGAFSGG